MERIVWLAGALAAVLAGRALSGDAIASTSTSIRPAAQADATVARAVAFLAAEVPRWRADEGCYSCHNNGDAARALIAAARAGHDVSDALADTLAFLSAPSRWESGPRGPMEDVVLARIQFALALSAAAEAGLVASPDRAAEPTPATGVSRAAGTPAGAAAAVDAAARLVAERQQPDGSWQLDTSISLGSPATYGRVLATWAARQAVLASTLDTRAIVAARADDWLRAVDPRTIVDASAVVLAFASASDAASRAAHDRARSRLIDWQAASGGWGPYANVRTEAFDTAIAVIALRAGPAMSPASAEAISRGRAYLRQTMRPDGSWPETTRPAGQQSYAQMISTTAWALLALL